jgi:catechol 2,3-dioxygenase-like lactoylglutathione lyase family enzyme
MMIAPQGFHHVAIFATDVERVAAFYCEVLGLPELARYHHPDGRLRSIWVGARAGGESADGFLAIEAVEHSEGAPGRGFVMVALAIASAARDEVRDALVARGLLIERETEFSLYVRDPEGNLVGLSHHPMGRGQS